MGNGWTGRKFLVTAVLLLAVGLAAAKGVDLAPYQDLIVQLVALFFGADAGITVAAILKEKKPNG